MPREPQQSTEVYLLAAYEAAKNSPDPSTQNGACIPIVLNYDDPQGELLITACNEFPPSVLNKPERLDRPLKYNFIEHAERNVIFKTAREGFSTRNTTMYVPWFACSDCARAIICSGVKRVVGHKQMMDKTPVRWRESIDIALIMLEEAGIKAELYDGVLNGPELLFNGEIWRP